MAAKTRLLRLRSSEGKVLVAPAWDDRPSAAAALPLDTGVPLRALQKAVLFWVRRALAEAIGGGGDDDWEAHFLRCLQQDGLAVKAVAAAVKKLRGKDALAGVVPDFTLAAAGHRPSSSSVAETSASHSHSHADDVVFAADAASSGPEATTSRAAASPDRAAASRARGRLRSEEDEADQEPARGHRKTSRKTAAASTASDDDDDDVRS